MHLPKPEPSHPLTPDFGHAPAPNRHPRHLIDEIARAHGFSAVGITRPDLPRDAERLIRWLERGHHGSMEYLARYGVRRAQPKSWFPDTIRVISVRSDYGKPNGARLETLANPDRGYIAQYALGRDYHKILRKKLRQLACALAQAIAPHSFRVFVDSGPIMEKPLAQNAGLGWIGKHTNLIAPQGGSYFFLGEILTTLPLETDTPGANHCGSCHACIDICPTQAIVRPYELDARRCISYLTIENQGPIPIEFRRAIGNRIFGCDDCQLICPMNKFARKVPLAEFAPRAELLAPELAELMDWTEQDFEEKTRGSALRRTGFRGWLRNLAVALGNAQSSERVLRALQRRAQYPDPLIREHVEWALREHQVRAFPE
ncbi:MAG: tRNA epoxyqueuosine(34) reductase QueG [Gammaproteobacteria bacterium]